MQEIMVRYFSAEKSEAALFIAVGIAAVVISFLLWRDPVYRGIVFPLAGVALIQLIVGGTVFFRTDSQLAALQTQFKEDPVQFQKAELERMEKVTASFQIYKAIEIILLLAGIGLTFWKPNDWIYSAGIGLIAQPAVMLVLDLFAERRAEMYVDALRGLVQV